MHSKLRLEVHNALSGEGTVDAASHQLLDARGHVSLFNGSCG